MYCLYLMEMLLPGWRVIRTLIVAHQNKGGLK